MKRKIQVYFNRRLKCSKNFSSNVSVYNNGNDPFWVSSPFYQATDANIQNLKFGSLFIF